MTTKQLKFSCTVGWLGMCIPITWRAFQQSGEYLYARILGGLVLPTLAVFAYYVYLKMRIAARLNAEQRGSEHSGQMVARVLERRRDQKVLIVTIALIAAFCVAIFNYPKRKPLKISGEVMSVTERKRQAITALGLDTNKDTLNDSFRIVHVMLPWQRESFTQSVSEKSCSYD